MSQIFSCPERPTTDYPYKRGCIDHRRWCGVVWFYKIAKTVNPLLKDDLIGRKHAAKLWPSGPRVHVGLPDNDVGMKWILSNAGWAFNVNILLLEDGSR